MKKKLTFFSTYVFLFLFTSVDVKAQCTDATVKWDLLDFLNAPTFATTARAQNQRFTIGKNLLNIIHNYTDANALGENATHTGSTGSFGTGEDVQFMGNGTITFTFLNAVSNARFSLYDVDVNQRITVTALNGVTAVPVTMVQPSGTTITITGSGTNTAVGTANATPNPTTSNGSTLNITVTGPVTSITVAVTLTGVVTGGPPADREDGSFWLSDIIACDAGVFATNYRAVAQPIAGMPSYVLTVRNNEVYYTNPANGVSRLLFTDPGHTNINSLAYDPVTKMVYYCYSLTASPSTEVALRRYDYEMDTFGICYPDVRQLGITLYDNGVTSGAASFYDGSLYLGVEANGTGYTTGRETKLWRIDFNASLFPIRASQVYAIEGLNHDWGDIGVSNGMLINFDADAGNENLFNVNLTTRTQSSPASLAGLPRQVSIDWQDNIFNIGNTGTSPSTGSIGQYNVSTGAYITTPVNLTYNGTASSGSWGDGAEAFRPKTDYGDAPTSFDPGPVAATHERDPRMRLGNTIGIENSKRTSANATGDGAEEDGITGSLTVGTGTTSFSFNVSVLNNTGANATLIGWIDLNNDGVFQASEGRSFTVASNASQQTVSIGWSSVTVSAPIGTTIFMRIRLTSSANGMTTSNTTGYFNDGEVEDYPVTVSAVLPELPELQAYKNSNKSAILVWKAPSELLVAVTEVQKSADGITWKTIASYDKQTGIVQQTDNDVYVPQTFYRLKFTGINQVIQYSAVRILKYNQLENLSIFPNPASTQATASIFVTMKGVATVQLLNIQGITVWQQNVYFQAGSNQLQLTQLNRFPPGIYRLRITTAADTQTIPFMIQ